MAEYQSSKQYDLEERTARFKVYSFEFQSLEFRYCL